MAESPTSAELTLSHLDSLPTLPAVAVKLLQATGEGDSSLQDVIRLLRADQALTAEVLSVARSAAVGARGEIATLERAVPLLGLRAVRGIVLAASVFDTFGGAGEPQRAFDRAEFWKHALAVACAARRLAVARPAAQLDPETAFIAGLLHDLGKLALDAVFPKAYERAAGAANAARADISDLERQMLGIDHTVAGRRVAERWKLPRALQDAIWLHHLSVDALPSAIAEPGLIGVVQLADTLAREQRVGYSGNHVYYEDSSRLAQRLGFSPEQIDAVLAPLVAEVADQAALLGLGSELPQELYIKSMTRANIELGKLNAELMAGNRRLAAAARYFRASGHFDSRLTASADLAEVVAAMAAAAAIALQRPRVAAFGLREFAAIDATWVGDGADPSAAITIPMPESLRDWCSRWTPGDAAVLVAPAVLTAVLAQPLSELGGGRTWLLPIGHDGALAGGLLYISEADEPARLAAERDDLRSFVASLGLAVGRANAQSAARRLSDELADSNRRLQQMQVELLRSRTLSMISEMASGAGHELNSPLTVISGRAQMLKSELRDPNHVRVLELITAKAHECSGIVSELMDFARPRAPEIEPFDLADLVGAIRAEWLEKSPPEGALFLVEAPAGERVEVRGDRDQIQVLLRELVANATDALGGAAGAITVRWPPVLEGGNVEIVVRDTGCGMSPAVLQRAFDPFFSHRRAGRGRGLGLPRAYRIAESHGGRIWLESRERIGTTAHVVLPAGPANANTLNLRVTALDSAVLSPRAGVGGAG